MDKGRWIAKASDILRLSDDPRAHGLLADLAESNRMTCKVAHGEFCTPGDVLTSTHDSGLPAAWEEGSYAEEEGRTELRRLQKKLARKR